MSSNEHMNDSGHLPPALLVALASNGQTHPHLQRCAFCREQYDMLAALEAHISDEIPSGGAAALPFRLAAQSDAPVAASLRLRQTWYLENGNVLLRVFEDITLERLIGYVICDTDRFSDLRIRFSGIDQEFRPSADGSFILGSRDIAIEPMTVALNG